MNSSPATDGKSITRRHFFQECGYGVGKIALAGLLTNSLGRAHTRTHFAPKAKRVIHLFQAGAPSQLELFDNNPTVLNKYQNSYKKHLTFSRRLNQFEPFFINYVAHCTVSSILGNTDA